MTMIASPQNEKLKLVRKLRERKHREREGLFVTEGEDLLAAGLAAGAEPRFVLTAAGRPGGAWDGEEVEPRAARRRSRRSARARGRSPSGRCAGPSGRAAAVRLPARRRRPRQRRHDRAHRRRPARRHGRARARAAPTRSRRRRCGRAWARSSPGRRCGPGSARRRRRGRRWSPTAARGSRRWPARRPLCLGAEREGLPDEVLGRVRGRGDDPAAPGGAESLNVAAAAAIACERISSPAMREARPDA